MDILFCVLVCFALIFSKIREFSFDCRVSRERGIVERERELFKARFAADDEMVHEALSHEWKKTELAETIRLRLLSEAGVDHKASRDYLTFQCHLVALGILAQYGKIPSEFLDGGIDWSRECWTITPKTLRSTEAAQMMERFIRWYDKELTDHGVTEHLFQKNEGVLSVELYSETGYRQKATNIQHLDSLSFGSILFWPSVRSSVLIGGSLKKISRNQEKWECGIK